MGDFAEIKCVGFDLDGTLYQDTSEISDKIRLEIVKKILLKNPNLKTIQAARAFFEERYKVLKSSKKVLQEAGYKNYSEIMDQCLINADFVNLIRRDNELIEILNSLSKKYTLFLITHSPEINALQKLAKIGIDPAVFSLKIFSDKPGEINKRDGTAFTYAMKQLKVPVKSCVFVGDSKSTDIIPAKMVGLKTISVSNHFNEADLSIDTINEIRVLL